MDVTVLALCNLTPFVRRSACYARWKGISHTIANNPRLRNKAHL